MQKIRRRPIGERVAALTLCVCVAVPACARPDPAAQPAVEEAILSVEKVREITRFADLDAESGPPTDQPQPDPTAPGPCKAALDQQVVFGDGVAEFRTVSYSAATDTGPGRIRGVAIVSQAVGRYPDADMARAAFDKLAPEVRECATLRVKNYEYDVSAPDPSTLRLRSNVSDIVYRVESSDLVSVVVVGMPDSGRIARDVADSMVERLR